MRHLGVLGRGSILPPDKPIMSSGGTDEKVGSRSRGPGRALGSELARQGLPRPRNPEVGLPLDGAFVLLPVPEMGWHSAGDRGTEDTP